MDKPYFTYSAYSALNTGIQVKLKSPCFLAATAHRHQKRGA